MCSTQKFHGCTSTQCTHASYASVYFEALDAAIVAIGDRFDQNDYSMYVKLEQLLLLAASQKDYYER